MRAIDTNLYSTKNWKGKDVGSVASETEFHVVYGGLKLNYEIKILHSRKTEDISRNRKKRKLLYLIENTSSVNANHFQRDRPRKPTDPISPCNIKLFTIFGIYRKNSY